MSKVKAPRARVCYICGRQYMLHSFSIHEKQCRELFEKWEAQKPVKERRKCPEDPMKLYSKNNTKISTKELDELNNAAHSTWSEECLVMCQNCGRSFLPEKLKIHQRSCTASNPAKGIIKKGNASSGGYNNDQSVLLSSFGSKFVSNKGKTLSFSNKTDCNLMGMSARERTDDYHSSAQYAPTGNPEKCPTCGRSFAGQSYIKHVKVCKSVFMRQRKPFDSSKQRALGTELEDFHQTTRRNNSKQKQRSDAKSTSEKLNKMDYSVPKWKAESMNFREAMKQARLVSKVEHKAKQMGVPLHTLLPSTMASAESRELADSHALQCPHCGRSFSQKAGERHIPQCRNIINKPTRLLRHSGVPSYSTLNSTDGRSAVDMRHSSTRYTAGNNTAAGRSLASTGGINSRNRSSFGPVSASKTYNISTSNESTLNLFSS